MSGTFFPEKTQAAVVSKPSMNGKFNLDTIAVIETEMPVAGHGEVVVEVHASSLNPGDAKLVAMAPPNWSYPAKIGSDVAGIAVALGPGVERIQVGDEVWGQATHSLPAAGGTFREYVAIPEIVLGLKPKSMNMIEAGATPLVALSGYGSLTSAAGGPRFEKNDVTVLVLGGSGGTGHVGIQIAKAMGASQVIATCSGANTEFVKSLGADKIIDYHKENYYEVLAPKSVDVVYDCVCQPGSGDQACAIIKDGGHFVSLGPNALPSESAKRKRPDINSYFTVCAFDAVKHDRIDAVAVMVEQGLLKVHIHETYKLHDISKAFTHLNTGRTIGKIALSCQRENMPY